VALVGAEVRLEVGLGIAVAVWTGTAVLVAVDEGVAVGVHVGTIVLVGVAVAVWEGADVSVGVADGADVGLRVTVPCAGVAVTFGDNFSTSPLVALDAFGTLVEIDADVRVKADSPHLSTTV